MRGYRHKWVRTPTIFDTQTHTNTQTHKHIHSSTAYKIARHSNEEEKCVVIGLVLALLTQLKWFQFNLLWLFGFFVCIKTHLNEKVFHLNGKPTTMHALDDKYVDAAFQHETWIHIPHWNHYIGFHFFPLSMQLVCVCVCSFFISVP